MTPIKLTAAVAAAVIVAVIGYNLIPRQPGFGSASPTPAVGPTPTPKSAPPQTPGPTCEDALPGCAGPLSAGVHQSAHFTPGFAFTTPAGWENPIDIEGIYSLTPLGTTPADLILVWSDVMPAEATAACTTVAKPGAQATVEGWMTYLTTNPGLIASNVHEVAMNGSTVPVVDLARDPAWVSPCTGEQGLQDVPLIKVTPPSPGDGYGLNSSVRMRAYVVGIGNQTVIVTVYSYNPGEAALADEIAIAEPVVTTFRWACNPESPPGPCWGRPDASGNPATPPPG